MHITFTVRPDYVTFRISDGRTGSEPNMGPGKWAPTVVLLLHKLSAISELGVTPGWSYEIIHD